MSKTSNSPQSNWPTIIGSLVAIILMMGFIFVDLKVMVYICFIIVIPLLLLKIKSDSRKPRK